MTQIQAEIDAYGTYARASALADFAELWAIHGNHVTEAILDDFLKDMGWQRKELELLTAGEELLDEFEVQGGQEVFDALRERQHALGDLYPFTVEDGTLISTNDVGPYRLLHAITIAHSSDLLPAGDVENLFERLVCRVLEARGLRVAHLGGLRNSEGSFPLALEATRTITGLPVPGVGDRSKHANDERVDAVAHFDWADGREVNWAFIGQVTCAKSDEWERKLAEPPTMRFEGFLGTIVPPIPFLAVPHHISTRRLSYLATANGRMVLDRLRLAAWISDVLPIEEELIHKVDSAGMSSPF